MPYGKGTYGSKVGRPAVKATGRGIKGRPAKKATGRGATRKK